MKVRAHQYDTVDALCWRHYGRTQESLNRCCRRIRGWLNMAPFTARAAGGAAGHYGVNHCADCPVMGLNYDA